MVYSRGGVWRIYCSLVVVCMLFAGCAKRSGSCEHTDIFQERNLEELAVFDDIVQQEAMLVNIPLPLYKERILPLPYERIENSIVLGYKSPLTSEQAVDFFLNEMERYGWKQIVTFNGFESLLQFENPDFYCTIIVRDSELNTSSIFIYMKRASIDARS